MSEQHILLDETDCIATMTLNRPPLPIAFAKRRLQRFGHWEVAQVLDYEVSVLEMPGKSRDVAEGIAAFLEKRDPHCEGR